MPTPSFAGSAVFGPIIKAKTAAYTVLNTESGTIFTTRGATVAVNFTLPVNSSVPIGFDITVYGVSAYGFTITSNPTDTLVVKNDATADTITTTTTSLIIGAAVRVVFDGTGWLTFNASAGPTYAIAT